MYVSPYGTEILRGVPGVSSKQDFHVNEDLSYAAPSTETRTEPTKQSSHVEAAMGSVTMSSLEMNKTESNSTSSAEKKGNCVYFQLFLIGHSIGLSFHFEQMVL